MLDLPLKKRVTDKIKADASGCWLWTGALDGCGYSKIGIAGKTKSMHPLMYELFKGPIPKGLEIDHLCRVRNCVNPDHLEAVTHKENMRRGDLSKNGDNERRKTHCKHGHEFTDTNTFISKQNKRVCRACGRRYDKLRWAARCLSNKMKGGVLSEK